ncbi:hypothetical protein L228DRAFT_244487 [Xylona heveae TC161]|uniref:Zinc knuckle-domain-containing protein n=1 Tax=Xylona heveae (strain CBS 132557 / TC161) TaxID=1328760 RepID=A0A165J093_XYLHT|nr:hypothetical protein L228DRAFT_244487 [Xylona heveae TC161]KZF25612.1 hypothetical protein L228DRAFT_244487 [Xylona heveae TC161]
MNRYRGPTLGNPSKATASTLCQKCLQRGHYSYECKTPSQERPYLSRPSRTQQLRDPKLLPKLTSDVPNDLLRKKGVADELLAKREEERGRKRAREESIDSRRGRSRSASSFSSSSVSTISTNRSLSRSPSPPKSSRHHHGRHSSRRRRSPVSPVRTKASHKRRRSLSSGSYRSGSSIEKGDSAQARGRNTRRRRSSTSPVVRGRQRSRSGPTANFDHKRSRSRSMDRSKIARTRRTMTPEEYDTEGEREQRSRRRAQRRYSSNHDRYGRSYRDGDFSSQDRRGPEPPPAPRERSLSPYSRRLALTQAMNMGR